MNTRIKELKISNYKKKIMSKTSFLDVKNIFYGDEDVLNNEFSKVAVNSEKSIVKEFIFYNVINGFENESQEYGKAIKDFKNKAKELFSNDELVIFNLKYNEEYFRLECVFHKFISNFSKIVFLDETIFLFDKERTKHVAILRMEYSFEVIVYQEG